MQKDIFVTGVGIISAIGNNTEQCFESLRNKKSGLGSIEILQTKHKDKIKVGEVKLTNYQLLDILGLSHSQIKKYSRTSLLGIIASNEAVNNSGIDVKDEELKTGLISATTVGGMDKTEIEIADQKATPDFLLTHPCGDSTNKICDYIGIDAYRTTISTACSSGNNAIIHGIKLIRHGIIDRAIVGGVDALSKFTLNGFNSLMILDKEFCKPFDKNRMGLNLGEGAGFLVIESEKSLKKRRKQAICKILGYANANDAYHQTASSPEGEGAFIAMSAALKMSNLQYNEIDYINAHGTATPNNDLSEGLAIKRVFEEKLPKFSSTKAYTGHGLGAAAGIEAVFSVLSIQKGMIFPNLNFESVIPELNIRPQTELKEANVRNVLSNSFGFGGNNSSIIFSK
ncbi:MAG: beta-ketoacyl-[acyl-carrier-protein] synthase family protein [Bacteroidetes bacterium]|jgi:3-oxoacyl-(acyl-carrier-protein) synthase|nr:beta-ketoacyl-[acyl-carrier-protein] synthase family protein [Bacteroidota bacterium]MBT6686353.1 beta-ketoacyl-[acyl-carrier-protein] synthase family protein [Bacteroidota bacterium]MBT7142186.1 beta-ketoacyl-[acyl-carrier-protein] synthase family protein [Bacteroidota bacterium]MBT7490459.1 beta-ketoacyl-[acyl-carrier-protein] synthase family protein [Bacteroidota bacterium]